MDMLIAIFVLGLILTLLIKDLALPSVAFLIGLIIVTLTGIIDAPDAFRGFGDQILITIGSLFVIARGVQIAFGSSASWVGRLLKPGKSHRLNLLRIMAPVGLVSGFINNTPVVAMLIDPIIQWGKQKGIPPSRFLMPLSYAAIFGGTLTLIGTSTNLVVSGVLASNGYEPFTFFELTRISAPIFISGLVLITWLAPKLLPDRHLSELESVELKSQYEIEMEPSEALNGKTVEQAKLRNLDRVFLGSITRANGDILTPVSPQTIIRNGDTLHFSGDPEPLMELSQLSNLHEQHKDHSQNLEATSYFEAVVGHHPTLINKTLRGIRFRQRYQAIVLAIFRSGERIKNIDTVRLKTGDTILLASNPDFEQRWTAEKDFLYVRAIDDVEQTQPTQLVPLLAILTVVIALLSTGAPLSLTFLVAAMLMVALRIIDIRGVINAVSFDLLIMLGAALGVAKAVEASGLADVIATAVIGPLGGFGALGVLVGVIIATAVLTELVTNAAAALLVMPIALSVANSAGIDVRALAIATALTASLSFISPIGYQTNTMVYSTGGYKFTDFVRLGAPIAAVSLTLLTSLIYFFYF